MYKKVLTLIIVIAMLLVGCSAGMKQEALNGTEASTVPEWLLKEIRAEFQKPELVTPEKINLVQVRLKESIEPQILAYVNVDKLNGVIMLFEDGGDGYKTVYKKNEPVYGVQVFGSGNKQLVSFVSGFGGSGMQENYFYILGAAPKGYEELWKGIAEKFSFGGPLPYTHMLGAIQMDISESNLVYTQYIRTYNKHEYDAESPDSTEAVTHFFKYIAETGDFLLIDTK